MINPEIGFTSDVIREPKRFVGRIELLRHCIRALNSSYGLLAVYGKRGVGKSSILRQVQQMALGDYELAAMSGLESEIPKRPRTYLTVYYSCDAMISNGEELLRRLCNDQDAEDGLLRLVPSDGKELAEFSRTKESGGGLDLKVAKWGAKGIESSKYVKVVPHDIVQTFRNFLDSIQRHQVEKMNRGGLLILLDEFDQIKDKGGIGSLIKSLSSDTVKFGICGIGRDLIELVEDHASVERLLEQGAVHVVPMSSYESIEILKRAESLFDNKLNFDVEVKNEISALCEGYPYFVQLLGKECVNETNRCRTDRVEMNVLKSVKDKIRRGTTFPTLESTYQRAIGHSAERQMLLHLLAEQPEDKDLISEYSGKIELKATRKEAKNFNVDHIDQLIPRLIDKKYGGVLSRVPGKQGVYEFTNPVFRLYVKLRDIK